MNKMCHHWLVVVGLLMEWLGGWGSWHDFFRPAQRCAALRVAAAFAVTSLAVLIALFFRLTLAGFRRLCRPVRVLLGTVLCLEPSKRA